MGSHRVGHDWSNLAAAAAAYTVFKDERFTTEEIEQNKHLLKAKERRRVKDEGQKSYVIFTSIYT